MLSDKYPVIIGIPPHPSSAEARRLFVFASGRDNHKGGRRRLGDDKVTEDIESSWNDHQAANANAPKSRPARSRASAKAAAKVAGARDPTLPPHKTKARVRVSDDLDRGSSPVFPSKRRVKKRGQVARRVVVWSTDDEIDALTSPREVEDDAEGLVGFHAGKRTRQHSADDVDPRHQSKRARSISHWRSAINIDTSEGDMHPISTAEGVPPSADEASTQLGNSRATPISCQPLGSRPSHPEFASVSVPRLPSIFAVAMKAFSFSY